MDRFHRTIDWVADAEQENKLRLDRAGHISTARRALIGVQSWVVLAVSGTLIGLVAVVMTITSGFLGDLREGYCSYAFYLNKSFCCLGQSEQECVGWREWPLEFPVYVLGSVLFACAACLIVLEVDPLAAGSGISEIKCIIGGFLQPGFLGWRVLMAKVMALPLVIASGLSVGKEGPSVHYAACVGNLIGEHLSSAKLKGRHSKRRDLVLACSAAGVAVAFGSPIGGVLFAIEELTSQSIVELPGMWRAYFCCLIATSVLSLLNPFRTGQMVLFSVQYDRPWHIFEIPFYIVLGIFGGLAGQLIISVNMRVVAMRKRFWANYPLQEVGILALITALVCFFNQFLRTDMTQSMQILFHECEHGGETHPTCDTSNRGQLLLSLALACIIRMALVVVSYGAKIPAGIFVPSLAIGALFGRFVGTVAWWISDSVGWVNVVNPGTFAFLGAGALLAGVMHITVTVVVVMFEITGALYYIIPLMIVVGVTKLVSNWVGAGGIADMAILANGYPFVSAEDKEGLEGKKAADIMVYPVAVLDASEAGNDHSTYPVVDSEHNLIGSVTPARSVKEVNTSPLMVTPETSLVDVNGIFANLGPQIIFVCDRGKLVGLITRKDLVRFLPAHKIEFSAWETRVGETIAAGLSRLSW